MELFCQPDRNKTDETHRVTAAVLAYMDEAGFKPVETEVPVCDGWIADMAGCIVPSETEAQRLRLTPPRPRWDYQRRDDAEYCRLYESALAVFKAAYAALPNPLTALIEVKTSRGDFLRDKKWLAEPPVNLCFLAAPKGLIRADERPEGWTLLEVSETGRVRAAARGRLFEVPAERQTQTVLAIAVRRDHQTRHARLREALKAQRVEAGERKTVTRVNDAVRAVSKIARGEGRSVEEVLFWHNIKRLPEGTLNDLSKLWGKAR